jgi:hypothetical protein
MGFTTAKKKEQKVIENPTISLNKLGEYLQANATRRQAIILAAKYPQDWYFKRYAEARAAAVNYFSNGFNPDILYTCIAELENKKEQLIAEQALSDNMNSDIISSISLLESLLDLNTEYFENLTIKPYNGDNTAIDIQGLRCTVSPELFLEGTDKKGNTVVGIGKFHTSKSYPFEQDTLLTIASVLYRFTDLSGFDQEIVERKLCISFDLHPKKFESAPNTYIRRWQQIEASAREIVDRWPNL